MICLNSNAQGPLQTKSNEKLRSHESASIYFVENKGQVADQNFIPQRNVLFSGKDGNLVYHLNKEGISYQLVKLSVPKFNTSTSSKQSIKDNEKNSIYRIDMRWINANTSIQINKGEVLPHTNNYYLNQCPNGVLNVKSYKDITYTNVYEGIHVKWYQAKGHLKYDYLVTAGADYKQIRIQISGAEKISLNKGGELVIQTPLGNIIEEAPLVLQHAKVLRSKWVIESNVISFEIENIDPKSDFVIDPLVRNWGTYYGGGSNDYGNSCSSDTFGNVYLAGWTDSNIGTVMATTGAHQTSMNGQTDAFLVKFNSLGQRLWATYYGAYATETDVTCTHDKFGNSYLSGSTNSNSSAVFASAGAHQTAFGGQSDAFIAKFNASGQRQWASYYGAQNDESARSCATDTLGNVYLCGWTVPIPSYTGTAIATSASHQSAQGGGVYDAFLVKFDSNGNRLWATYYGGSDMDWAYCCSTDLSGNVYMSGVTSSASGTAIATPGSHQPTSAFVDAYLVKFNPSGQRVWGTYYGGASGGEDGLSCTTDLQGNVYLAGNTNHANADTVIASTNAHQTNFAGGSTDAFLAKFNSAGIRQWATYYGGYLTDNGFSCATNTNGDVYLSGYTQSDTGNVISTNTTYQKNHGGQGDAYLVKFDAAGNRLWGTYYGSIGDDWSYACATSMTDLVYMAGYTNSDEVTNGPVIASNGSHQAAIGGSNDAFLVQFNDCSVPASAINTTSQSNLTICNGMSTTLTASGSGTLSWFSLPTGGSSLSTGTILIIPVLSVNTTYYVENVTCTLSANRTAIQVNVTDCTAIQEQVESLSTMFIYPNPSAGVFIIQSSVSLEIQILNACGQLIKHQKVQSGKNQIDLTGFAQGIYFIKANGIQQLAKVMIQY